MDFNFGNRDHYTKVETIQPEGFFARLGKAVGGVAIGFLLFVSAFPLLRWGENRQNLAEFVEKAVTVATGTQPANNGLVRISGLITSSQTVNDPLFLNALAGKKFLRIERNVEIYAWKENKKTETSGNQKKTTYDYVKEWTSRPDDSSKFDTVQGHQNIPLTIENTTSQVTSALVGTVAFDAGKASFYDSKELKIEEAMVNKGTGKPLTTDGKYIYQAFGVVPPPAYPDPYGIVPPQPAQTRNPAANPQIGDIRVSYRVFADGLTGTVAGNWDGTQISGHVYDKTSTFLGVFPGSVDEFAAHLNFQHSAGTWGIRIGTFFMLWIGLGLMIGPLTVVVQSIPLIGGAGKAMIGFVTGILAFVFWCIAMLFAHTWLLIALVLVFIGGLVAVIKISSAKKTATT